MSTAETLVLTAIGVILINAVGYEGFLAIAAAVVLTA